MNNWVYENGTDVTGGIFSWYYKTKRFNKFFYHFLVLVTSLQICHEDVIWCKRTNELTLIRKYIGFIFVYKIIIDHAPYRGISGSWNFSYDFDGVLPVKHIIYTVAAAYFNRVNLVNIKFLSRLFNLFCRNITLISLIWYEVFNWDEFKMYYQGNTNIAVIICSSRDFLFFWLLLCNRSAATKTEFILLSRTEIWGSVNTRQIDVFFCCRVLIMWSNKTSKRYCISKS